MKAAEKDSWDMDMANQRGLNTKRPTIVFLLSPTKPLPSRIGKSPPAIQWLVKSKEMTGRGKDDREKKISSVATTFCVLETRGKSGKIIDDDSCLLRNFILVFYVFVETWIPRWGKE
jgi:hypothetical protein